jgi:Bacteriophage Mu, Gp27
MMIEKTTRGRASTIDTLPGDIKVELDRLLPKKGVTQKEILQTINTLLDEAGIEKEISRSSLNRYASRMSKVGARIRDMREVANIWTSKLGDAPTGEVTKLLTETLKTIALETTLNAVDGDEPVSPKLINELALAISRIEKAAEISDRREAEIRTAYQAEIETALNEAEGTLIEQQGLTRETIACIKKEILGI